MPQKSKTPSVTAPHPEEIVSAVRKILFGAIPPVTRTALNLDNDPDRIDTAWNLGLPYPLGLGPQRIDSLLGSLNKLIQQYQPSHSITTAELDQQNLVSDLCDLIVQHVQPDRT